MVLDNQIQMTEKGNDSQSQIIQLMEILKDQDIVDLLGGVHRSMMSYYLYYANQKTGLLNFDGFSRFCTDFEIFPDILSKPKIMRFFKTLSGFFETTNQSQGEFSATDDHQRSKMSSGEQGTIRRDVIDEHLFVEALALTAFEIQYQDPQPGNAEKIVLLMEKLNHSEGPQRVLKAVGKPRFTQQGGDPSDLLYFIRISHPQFFQGPQYQFRVSPGGGFQGKPVLQKAPSDAHKLLEKGYAQGIWQQPAYGPQGGTPRDNSRGRAAFTVDRQQSPLLFDQMLEENSNVDGGYPR